MRRCRVTNALAMHLLGERDNREAIKAWESFLRAHVTKLQYTLLTRALFTVHKKQCTNVLLEDAFPVLRGASLAPIHREVEATFIALDCHHLGACAQMAMSFETAHHGPVHLMAISIAERPHTAQEGHLRLVEEVRDVVWVDATHR